MSITSFAELQVRSNFSFLTGASHPEELVRRAAELGYEAIALTDEASLAGIVKAHVAAREVGIPLIVGSLLRLQNPESTPESLQLILYAPSRLAYAELSTLITQGRRRSEIKGEYRLFLNDVLRQIRHCLALWLPPDNDLLDTPDTQQLAQTLKAHFGDRLWMGVSLLADDDDARRFHFLSAFSAQHELRMVACNDVHMHIPDRKPLQDLLTAIRLNTPVQQLGRRLFQNSERHLRPVDTLSKIYPATLLEESVALARRCHFSLDELRYEYPEEVIPPGKTAQQYLRELTEEGLHKRYPSGIPAEVRTLIEKELDLIHDLAYEHFFLTVHDIVVFARSRNILCQGRGSAANSAVCFCLGITEVDPSRSQLLFERFLSRERNEPPDIDVDFEHERREEVIQYLYRKYTRDRAALAATVITYRPRSAIRDVGKALGLEAGFIDHLASSLAWWDKPADMGQRFQESGLSADSPVARQFLHFIREIQRFPRHLSQHVGGFVISRGPVAQLVPVENAAMEERTIIQWDKDDLESLGLLKVDVLALGMLTAIRKTLDLIGSYQSPLRMQDIPREDPATYAMLSRGDSIGVFQVESRAQMSMLPRLKPRTFYDLVVEVAIVRPGPIQGDMVHPYLRRRNGEEPIDYPSEEVRHVLERTYGVPIFQEQVIKLAMVAAGFTGGEADQLRRAMASWKKTGELEKFHAKLVNGMRERGYALDYAERIWRQIQGFGEYGFPESHAASFALLVYVSAWLKRHHTAAFCCGLLNSLPMGFYSPSQLIQDVRRHGITVFPCDVHHSHWNHQLERTAHGKQALRLGLRLVSSFNTDAALRIIQARRHEPFGNLQDLRQRANLSDAELAALIEAGACQAISGHRRQAHWEALAIADTAPLYEEQENRESHFLSDAQQMEAASEAEEMLSDYRATSLTLNRHPMALLRQEPRLKNCRRASELLHTDHGRFVRVAGLVTGRQRPGTASGVLFMTVEDETGNINVVCWTSLQERRRKEILNSRIVMVKGILERKDNVTHLIAGDIEDISALMEKLAVPSRDFH